MKKRAQFFLLAAVIISAIVLSIGLTANYARVSKEPKNFYDYSYEVKRETGAVMDYEVYSGFNEGTDLRNFVRLLAKDIRDKNPEANFMFIYGDNSSLSIENYGEDVAQVSQGGSSSLVQGGKLKINSTISYLGNRQSVYNYYDSLGGAGANATFISLGSDASIDVEILGSTFTFPITEYRQVIFIIQKEEGDEAYISIE